MGRKLKLLPHWCQVAGYAYVLGLLLCFVYALVYMTGIFPEDSEIINGVNTFLKHSLTNWNLVGALNFIMIFLAIFSKEKVWILWNTSWRRFLAKPQEALAQV